MLLKSLIFIMVNEKKIFRHSSAGGGIFALVWSLWWHHYLARKKERLAQKLEAEEEALEEEEEAKEAKEAKEANINSSGGGLLRKEDMSDTSPSKIYSQKLTLSLSKESLSKEENLLIETGVGVGGAAASENRLEEESYETNIRDNSNTVTDEGSESVQAILSKTTSGALSKATSIMSLPKRTTAGSEELTKSLPKSGEKEEIEKKGESREEKEEREEREKKEENGRERSASYTIQLTENKNSSANPIINNTNVPTNVNENLNMQQKEKQIVEEEQKKVEEQKKEQQIVEEGIHKGAAPEEEKKKDEEKGIITKDKNDNLDKGTKDNDKEGTTTKDDNDKDTTNINLITTRESSASASSASSAISKTLSSCTIPPATTASVSPAVSPPISRPVSQPRTTQSPNQNQNQVLEGGD